MPKKSMHELFCLFGNKGMDSKEKKAEGQNMISGDLAATHVIKNRLAADLLSTGVTAPQKEVPPLVVS